MNRVDAAVIRDLRRGIAAIQQHTLQTMFTAPPPAERPAKPEQDHPVTPMLPTDTPKGLNPCNT